MISAILLGANISGANLDGANLSLAYLGGADLNRANLTSADLTCADLSRANLVETDFTLVTITGCRTYGASAWNVTLVGTVQDNLVITKEGEPVVTVDDLEVGQFIYLILNNTKIRNAIDTICRKGVLILGRFTARKHVLEAIKKEISRLGMLPIVFDFERPIDRDFTETVMTLAGMSRFIVADITAPKSVPLELQATVRNYIVSFVPLLQEGEQPFSMFEDLWKKHRDWVLEPVSYESVDQLIRVFENAVVDPANERLELLRIRKAEKLVVRRASDYEARTLPVNR